MYCASQFLDPNLPMCERGFHGAALVQREVYFVAAILLSSGIRATSPYCGYGLSPVQKWANFSFSLSPYPTVPPPFSFQLDWSYLLSYYELAYLVSILHYWGLVIQRVVVTVILTFTVSSNVQVSYFLAAVGPVCFTYTIIFF